MRMSRVPRVAATILLLILLLLLTVVARPAEASPIPHPSSASTDGRLSLPGKGPAFLLAVNYEGPADRAWQMWEDAQYDPALIEADLHRARDAGFSAVRVFVQPPLAKDIQANRWTKLDGFMSAAQRQGLAVILSLYDYEERDLAKVADVDARIAGRYAGNTTLLAYDLKNEPHFSDLAAAAYPSGNKAPIQAAGADQTLAGYRDLIGKAGGWVSDRGYLVTVLDYLKSPEGRRWDPLLATVNASLSMWLQPQVDAIRKSDKQHPITAAYSDLVLASLPANGVLDYATLHRYPNASRKGVEDVARALNGLRSAFPDKPVVLGEFGFSNDGMTPEDSASYEMAVYLQLLSEGLAGGAKWMLNDFPKGFNPRQNAFGAYAGDGSTKPIVAALKGLAGYLDRSPSRGGQLYLLGDSPPGYKWAYEAEDALAMSSSSYQGTRLSFEAARLSQLLLTWTDPKTMRLYSTSKTDVDLDPGALVGDPKMGSAFTFTSIQGADRQPAPFSQNGSRVKASMEGGRWYELTLPRSSENKSEPRSLDYDVAGGHFFTQANGRPLGASGTGFSVADDNVARFWSEFKKFGGVDVLGYPVTQRFTLDGFTLQAFQKGVLQWRPETRSAVFLNSFDLMHDRGMDDWLLVYRQIPKPFDTTPDTGLSWNKVVERHLAILDATQPIKARFLADPAWEDHYGLPVAQGDMGSSMVVRAQRASFQLWKQDVPWAKKGDVTVANGGDLVKEAYIWPVEATVPQSPPAR